MGRQQGVADRVGVARIGDVDGAADRLLATALDDLTAVRAGDVVDPLVRLAVLVEPALDDLDAVEVGVVGIAAARGS